MSHPKNTTAPSPAQLSEPRLRDLRHLFRAAYGAHGIARILLDDSAESGQMLGARDREALMSALEHCTSTLFAHHEYGYTDALPSAADDRRGND